MNAKKFSDALSALDGRYVEEAARYRRKHGQSFWVRWGAAAACLCLLAAGGALLIQGRGRAAPDPQQVQIPNPILTVASAAEMEAYLDFKVPVLEKEVEAYSVFISDGYPTMGQVDYADGSQFRIQYGSGDISGIYGGRYVEEAARYRRKHGQSFWVRWGAAAACLCLLAAGGALLIQGRGRAAPDPQQVQIPNPILTVASAAEMEAYLDFKVPVLEKEVEAYSVFISDGYPTMGQVDYADGSQFRIQYGSGDISGIYGGTLEESREIAGVSVAYYQYDSMSYAIWEANGFACSYLYTNGGDAEVDLLIQQGP